jgi:hypothetical protein
MVEEVLTPSQQIVGDPEFSNRAYAANLMMAAPKCTGGDCNLG